MLEERRGQKRTVVGRREEDCRGQGRRREDRTEERIGQEKRG